MSAFDVRISITCTIECGTRKSALAWERDMPWITVCSVRNAKKQQKSYTAANVTRRDLRGPCIVKSKRHWCFNSKKWVFKSFISWSLLLETAKIFYLQLMHEDFVCSNGYLRPAIASGRVMFGEDTVADTHAAEDWQHGQLCQFLGNFHWGHI